MPSWRRRALVPGIYDEIVTSRVRDRLDELPEPIRASIVLLSANAVVAAPLADLLREAIDACLDELDQEQAIALGEEVLATLVRHAPAAFGPAEEWKLLHQQLKAIVAGAAAEPDRPLGSLHRSSLIANAEGDRLLDNLRSEFDSSDSVDVLCAFVKLSGYEKLRGALERHCSERGRPLRVLTTTYMGASDGKAIEKLARLPNATVKVSYDVEVTRLHAKAWQFHRKSGLSTAYVGSSNLSHAAQTEGLEWNVRIAPSDPALLAQLAETFEQYWEDANQFETFDPRSTVNVTRLRRALSANPSGAAAGVLIELEPRAFQKPVLEELAAARVLNRHRNLLVAATGTGKTVMAALDYRALHERKEVDTLLYVAHRREILEQARQVFRSALQMGSFGEILDQFEKPAIGRHVFASIQSLAEYDVAGFEHVILDEAHHTAAQSWQRLLERIRPRELLGLTGTPERADGIDYEEHFPRPWVGNLRVWNAIPDALVPFRYYVLDVEGVNLAQVQWVAGRYAESELAGKLIDGADLFVRRAVRALQEYTAEGRDPRLRAIAFCVDKRHAQVIAELLGREGYRTLALVEDTPATERRNARADLDEGRIDVLCVVDLYNEGVDVPNVDTLLFFRPTESATVFLQQLGRGLRRTRTKAELVVFDLTGRQHLGFRFDRRLRALLGHTPRELRETVDRGFGPLPSGCHIHFDEKAREQILEQIRRAIPSTWRDLKELLREPAHAALDLVGFLRETDVELTDIYAKDRSWTLLRREIGLDRRSPAEGEEDALANVHKLLHVGDPERLDAWRGLARLELPAGERDRRCMAMLFGLLYGPKVALTPESWALWSRHTLVREEITALEPILRARNAVLAPDVSLDLDNPLRLHATYQGVELSAAFADHTKSGQLRHYYSGVERVAGGRYDMLLVTIEKAPALREHLRYRDFPLSEHLFHWQSKSATTQDSKDGRRHLDPQGSGCVPLLFVRLCADAQPGVTSGFQYLGPVSPDRFEGDRPITIEWRLAHAMPASLLQHGRVAA